MFNKGESNMKSKNLRFSNTYESGSMTFLFLKNRENNNFLAVCLEFDLEAEAKSFIEAQEKIEGYAKLWLENVRENKLPEELLNKSAPQEYWDIANALEEEKRSRKRIVANYASSIRIPISTSFFPYNKLLPF